MNGKIRDLNIELMRFIFMFLICLVHAVSYVPARWCHPLSNVSYLGVIGFVLISGYFGIRFSFLKALKIEGIGLGCAVTVVMTAWIFGATFTPSTAVLEVFSLFKNYWFIHAYVFMMVLSTLLTSASSLRAYIPFFLVVYGWSFAMLIPGVQRFIPRTSGLEPYSGITLFAAYLIGRLYHTYDLDRRLSEKHIVPLTLVMLIIVPTIGPFKNFAGAFARYNSPFLVLAAVGIFWLLRKIRVPEVLAPFLRFLTPSVLSVYLLHCNPYGYRVFVIVEQHLLSFLSCLSPMVAQYMTFLLMALFALIIGIVLDLPRRLVVSGVQCGLNILQR